MLPAKVFLFVMTLLTPNGPMPPHKEPTDSLEACMAKVAAAHADFATENENFIYMAGCIQVSTKHTPA